MGHLMTTMEDRAVKAYLKLIRAADTISNRAHRLRLRDGLSVTQFAVLEALHHNGQLCQKDIAQKIFKSNGNITTVIDNLEKRGLARRVRQQRDRRYVVVELTDAGRELIARSFPLHVEAIVHEFGHLSEEEMETLGRLCRKLAMNTAGHE